MTTIAQPTTRKLSPFQAAKARYSDAEITAALAEYPETDGMPLPDGFEQEPHFYEIIGAVREHFRPRPEVIVSGNTFIYYDEGTRRNIAPDCYVAFGVSEAAIPPYNSYLVWRMGKPPDFALEIGSKATAGTDTGRKRTLYAQIGIGEYWRYDPTKTSIHYGEKLVGERLVNGRYERLPLSRMPDGSPWGYSPTLDLDLCWTDETLRFYDPAAGRYLPTRVELDDARRYAETALRISERARQSTVADLRVAEEARLSAEAEAAALREELRRLRG